MKLSTAIIAGVALAGAALSVSGANAAVLLGQYDSAYPSFHDVGTVAVQNDGAIEYSDVVINGTDFGALAAGATTGYINVGDNESGSNPVTFTVVNGATYTFSTTDALNDCENACTSSQTFLTSQAVPEPASWALMLVGVGALGLTMRSKRQTAVTA